MTVLPAAPWQTRTGLDALLAALEVEAGRVRYVGGAVRDTLLGLPVHDVDLATQLMPDELLARLRAAKIKAIPTGLAHGTVTAVLADGPIEITTLRRDVATDGRRATIAYTEDWHEDAARRDFTINALFADPRSGELFDYFSGLDDLRAGRVVFIGDPFTRIAEDHLRILRFFRFHARFGRGAPDPAALAACTARANDLMALSRERIADELLKILALPAPQDTLALMIAHGLFAPVIPEIDGVRDMPMLLDAEQRAGTSPAPLRRLAALLPAEPVLVERIAARLKLSNAQRKHLGLLAGRTAADWDEPRALAYRIGAPAATDRLLILGADVSTLQDWTPPKLPISGGTLVAHGLSAGPSVAAALREVERQWIAEHFVTGDAFERIVARVVAATMSQ